MAVVAFTSYSTRDACEIINTYVSDGHGDPVGRSNRYIGDGHGGSRQCLGHKCPSDPVLATAYMDAKRWNYERQHTISPNRQKSCVTHIQLFVCPTEEDHVPPEERLEMTEELIERTILRDFPSIYIAHDNTPQGHCHISLCPYSEDGSHKLCMNNKLLYDLRRAMDYICVEHGYSIIECPELWGDKAYRQWFLEIKERNVVTVHPPRKLGSSFAHREKKRARNYSRSKRAQIKRKDLLEAYYQRLTAGYSPEKDALFYTSPWLYNPVDPRQPLRIRQITMDGKNRSELELCAAAMGAWAYECEKKLVKDRVAGTEKLQKRLHTIMIRAYASRQLLEELDIRTQEELVLHLKECGQDIGTLKRGIKKVETELAELQPIMQLLEHWEEYRDGKSNQALHANGLNVPSEREMFKKQYTDLIARKEQYQVLLDDRSKEYRHLKEVEKTLNPASCKEAWESYLSGLFEKNVIQQARWISVDFLEEQIYELGTMLGISEDVISQYMTDVQNHAGVIRSQQFQEYRKRILSASETKRQGYERYYSGVGALEDLWDLQEKLAGFGLLGFLLSILVECIADMTQSITKMELSMALWEAALEKWYAEWQRKKKSENVPYYPEVQNNILKERQEIADRIQRMVDGMSEHYPENQARRSCREEIDDRGKKNIAMSRGLD